MPSLNSSSDNFNIYIIMILVSVECFLFICDFLGSWCGEWFLFLSWTWVLCYEIPHFIRILFFRKLPLTLHGLEQGRALDDGENCGSSPPLSCDTGEREEAPCYHWMWKSRVPTWSPLAPGQEVYNCWMWLKVPDSHWVSSDTTPSGQEREGASL